MRSIIAGEGVNKGKENTNYVRKYFFSLSRQGASRGTLFYYPSRERAHLFSHGSTDYAKTLPKEYNPQKMRKWTKEVFPSIYSFVLWAWAHFEIYFTLHYTESGAVSGDNQSFLTWLPTCRLLSNNCISSTVWICVCFCFWICFCVCFCICRAVRGNNQSFLTRLPACRLLSGSDQWPLLYFFFYLHWTPCPQLYSLTY